MAKKTKTQLLDIEKKVIEIVEAIEESFIEARVPIGAGIAVGMSLIIDGVRQGEKVGLADIRRDTIQTLQNALRYLERSPAWVEQPGAVM